MTTCRLIVATVALGLGAAVPAHADVVARMSVSDLTVRLADVDPADGHQPELIWRDSKGGRSTSAGATMAIGERRQDWIDDRGSDAAMFAPMQVSVSTPRGETAAEVVGDGPGTGTGFLARGSLQGRPGLPLARASAGATLTNTDTDSFVLGPGTAITFTAQVDIFLQTTIGARVFANGATWYEYASARAYLDVGVQRLGSGQRWTDSAAADAGFLYPPGPPGPYDGETVTLSQVMTATLVNRTDAPMIGAIDFRGGISIGSVPSVSAVPEPGTGALALAGLALLGIGARRRTRDGQCRKGRGLQGR